MLRLTAPRHSAPHCVIKFFVPLICHLCKWNSRARARTLLSAAPGKITLFQHKTYTEAAAAAAGTAVMCNHFIGGLCEFFACSPSPTRHSPANGIERESINSDADPLVKCIFTSRSRVRDRKPRAHNGFCNMQSEFFKYKDAQLYRSAEVFF